MTPQGRRAASDCLILWDIDKTLVDIGGISREIYAEAFELVTGQALREMPDMAGKTDRELTLAALSFHGVTQPERSLEQFYDALAQIAVGREDEIKRRGCRLPGAFEAMEALDQPGVVQTVVTGNIRPIAELKLRTFGLAEHIDFDIGGYGSDDDERAALVLLARERAAVKHGESAVRQLVVIGDTTYDIAGAKANDAIAIGVASGATTVEELAAAGADAVLPSLVDTAALLRLVLADVD